MISASAFASPPPGAAAPDVALATEARTLASAAPPPSPPAPRPPRVVSAPDVTAGWIFGVKKAATASTRRTTGTRTSSATGYAAPKKTSTTKTSTARDPLAFLSDKKLTVEEKLFRLMMYVADKYDKALEKKMKEFQSSAGGETTSSASTGTPSTRPSPSKKKSGLFGSIGGIVKAVVAPGLALLDVKPVQALAKTVAGPVLAAGATAMGFPQAAPLMMQMGPQVVDAATKLSAGIDALTGSSGGGGGGSSGGTSGGGSSTGGSSSASSSDVPQIQQAQIMELQYLSEKQKEMFSMVSNVLRAMHDTRMSIVNNLR